MILKFLTTGLLLEIDIGDLEINAPQTFVLPLAKGTVKCLIFDNIINVHQYAQINLIRLLLLHC